MNTSTCHGRNELCHGRGPAWPDDTASTAIIGQRQAAKAKHLWHLPLTEPRSSRVSDVTIIANPGVESYKGATKLATAVVGEAELTGEEVLDKGVVLSKAGERITAEAGSEGAASHPAAAAASGHYGVNGVGGRGGGRVATADLRTRTGHNERANNIKQAQGNLASSDSAMLLDGPVDYRHMFLNMSGLVVAAGPFTRAGVTCPAALGFSFAAGTTDGKGCVAGHTGWKRSKGTWARRIGLLVIHLTIQCRVSAY
jgi:hypothetical protein